MTAVTWWEQLRGKGVLQLNRPIFEIYLLYSTDTVSYYWPDLDSNCWARAECVSFTNPQLNLPNLVWPGDIFITKLLLEMLTASAAATPKAGIDCSERRAKKKEKRKMQIKAGIHAGHWVKWFIWVLQEQASSWSCFPICNNKDHLDYNISHCHSNSTICGFHGENCEKQSPHTGACQQSWIFFIELSLE